MLRDETGHEKGLALLALYMLQCGMTRPRERVGVDIVNETQAELIEMKRDVH